MRAELVNRLAAAGLPRIEAVSFVRDDRVPQMAGAEEVVAGIERARRHRVLRASCSTSGATSASRATGLDRVNATLGATEEFNRRNGNASLDEAIARVERILRRGAGAGDGHDQRRLRLPVRGAGRPGRGGGARRRASTRPRSSSRTRSASRRRARSGALVDAHRRRRLPRAQHAQHRLRERARRARGGRDGARRLGRRPRRLPVRAARERQRRDRGSRLPARARGRRDRASTSTR